MTERTFFVRVNLDDMAAEIIGLDSTEERGLWLEGFIVGSRGKNCREDWQGAKLEGYSFGLRCFTEAEEFRGKQSAKGLASVEARRNRKATSSQPEFNHGSTMVQPDTNQTSTHPTTNIQQPITNNEKPKKARQAAFSPSMFDRMIPAAFANDEAFVSKWRAWVISRHNRRKPISELAAREQLEKLESFGLGGAIESLRQSIEGDWQGIFPPKDLRFAPAQAKTPTAPAQALTYAEQQQLLPMSQRWKS